MASIRNSVILNGKDSRFIEGLLIQELPPITKPQIRTSVDEIDGKSGDILTKLGYSAYDRQMSIGLYGDFDIDEVIRFFDSSGEAIFSNEPDKRYKYDIIKEIDFERLLRFKTANVTFHVQPYKLSSLDDDGISKNTNLLIVPDFTLTKNGLTITASSGVITVSGTPTKATEVMLPVEGMTDLEAGNYSVMCDVVGDYAGLFRLVSFAPLNSMSLGGTYMAINDVTYNVTQATDISCGFLWLYIAGSSALDFTMDLKIYAKSINVFNSGNTKAMPIITLYGTGTIYLSVNDGTPFAVVMPSGNMITLDVELLEAYVGNTLFNRYVLGDYEDLYLEAGDNRISWTGNVAQIKVERYSQWI